MRRHPKISSRKTRLGAGCVAAGLALFSLTSAAPSQPPPIDPNLDQEKPGFVPDPSEEQLLPEYRPQPVYYRSNEPPGTIIVQTDDRFLYVVQDNKTAIRYGIGVGREGFQWSGLLKISRKQEWPDWRPPPEMIKRQPYLPRFMAGGPGNPLGARALYLGNTSYRIHGTNQPETIGYAVSSGCIRLVNPDVINLYDRVPVGTRVVVRQAPKL
ncbi:L,D-transpeptidase [Labrys neptuniae]